MLVQIAEGRSLPAAKGVVGDRNRDRHVDTDHADLDARGEIAGRVAVTGEDGNAVTHLVVVGELDGVLVGRRTHHRQNGAEDLFLVDAHVGGHMVEQTTAHVEAVLIALHLEAAAVDDKLGAFLHTNVDVALDALQRLAGDDGAEVGRGVGRRADLQALDTRDQLFHQPLGRVVTDRNSNRNRHAALAGRAVAGADQRVDGLVHVRVGHDDHVVLGAAEALHALTVGAAAAVDVLGDRGRADKADGLDVGIVEDRIDNRLVTVDDIEDAGRQACFEEQFGDAQRHARVALGRLQDEGIATGNRRRNLPQRDHRREVERGDASDDAERLAHRIDVNAGAGAVGELALHHVRGTDADFDNLEAALDVAPGVGNGLAMLAGQQFGQRVIFLVDQFEEAHQHAHAALRVGRSPGRLCRLGVFDGSAQFLRRGQRHCGTDRTVHRLQHVLLAPAGSGDMLAADEMTVVDHCFSPNSLLMAHCPA